MLSDLLRSSRAALGWLGFVCTLPVAAPAATYYSQSSGAPTTLSRWNTSRAGGGAAPVDFQAGDTFTVQAGHQLATTSPWTLAGPGNRIVVEAGGQLAAAGSLVATSHFQLADDGAYVHDVATTPNGSPSDLPGTLTRSFGAASRVEIRQWGDGTGLAPVPLPAGVTWGHLVIDVATLAAHWSQAGALTSVAGSLTVRATGGAAREFQLAGGGGPLALALAGDLEVAGGIVNLAAGGGAGTLTLQGGLSVTGGTLRSDARVAIRLTPPGFSFVQVGGPGATLDSANFDWRVEAAKFLGLRGANLPLVAPGRSIEILGYLYFDPGASVANTGTWTYGPGANLFFSQTSGTIAVGPGAAWWPAVDGPPFVGLAGGELALDVPRSVQGLDLSGLVTNGQNLTVAGVCTLNTGGAFSGSPVFLAGSTLHYNSAQAAPGPEWTPSGLAPGALRGAGAGQPAAVRVVSGQLTLDASPRCLPGGLQITGGGFALTAGGDLTLGGSWGRAAATTFTPNDAMVWFAGADSQLVSISSSGPETFARLGLARSAGSLVLLTPVQLTASTGDALRLAGDGTLDLAHRKLSLTGGGRIRASGGARRIVDSAGGAGAPGSGGLAILAPTEVVADGGGSLVIDSSARLLLQSGTFDAGPALTTIRGFLQREPGGAVVGNAPLYAAGSILLYAAGAHARGLEWTAGPGSSAGLTPGYPAHVTVGAGATLDYVAGAPSVPRAMGGNLTLAGGSGALTLANASAPLVVGGDCLIEAQAGGLTMAAASASLVIGGHLTLAADSGGLTMGAASAPLLVGGDVTVRAPLQLSATPGGDLHVGRSWSLFGSAGHFQPQGRAVRFVGSAAGQIGGDQPTAFAILAIARPDLTHALTVARSVTADSLELVSGAIAAPTPGLLTVRGAIQGGSAAAYVTGFLTREIAGGLSAGPEIAFPLGYGDFGGGYAPFALVTPTTTGGAPFPLTVGLVTEDPLAPDPPGYALRRRGYWHSTLAETGGRLTSTAVAVTDASFYGENLARLNGSAAAILLPATRVGDALVSAVLDPGTGALGGDLTLAARFVNVVFDRQPRLVSRYGGYSGPDSTAVSVTGLFGDLTLTAADGCEISLDASLWTTTALVPVQPDGTTAFVLHVRTTPLLAPGSSLISVILASADWAGGFLPCSAEVEKGLPDLRLTGPASFTYHRLPQAPGYALTPPGPGLQPPQGKVTLDFIPGGTAPSAAGAYLVTATSTEDDYYVGITTGAFAFAIAPAPLQVVADRQVKAKGALDPALTYLASGLLAPDALVGALTRAAGETPGVYGIGPGTLSAGGNYALAFTPADFVVTGPRAGADRLLRPPNVGSLTLPAAVLLANDDRITATGGTSATGLTLTAVAPGPGNAVTLQGGQVLFTPNPALASDTFTYTLSDGPSEDTGTVTVTSTLVLRLVDIGPASYHAGANTTSRAVQFQALGEQEAIVEYSLDLLNWTPLNGGAVLRAATDGALPASVSAVGDQAAAWNRQMHFRARTP